MTILNSKVTILLYDCYKKNSLVNDGKHLEDLNRILLKEGQFSKVIKAVSYGRVKVIAV